MKSANKTKHDNAYDSDIDDNGSSPPVTLASVVLHRHGQGQHNVEGLHIWDPPLTAQGRQEAREIGEKYQHGTLPRPQLVIVSPLRRTLTTACIAMETIRTTTTTTEVSTSNKILATDLCREINNLNACNYYDRTALLQRRDEYPLVDFSLLEHNSHGHDDPEDGPFEMNGHEYRPKLKHQVQILQRRCRRFLQFLQDQLISSGSMDNKSTTTKVQHVSVFTHASFLRALSCVVLGINAHHGVPPLPTGGTMRIELRREVLPSWNSSSNNHHYEAEPTYYWALAADDEVVVSQMPHIVVYPPKQQQNEATQEE